MFPWYLYFSWRSLVFPNLLFSSISLHWSLKKAFLSLFAILWNSAFGCLYLSFSHLLFASLLFLKRCLVFPIVLFSSISLHWSLRKAFLFHLANLWNSAFRCLYLSFSPLLFASLLFTAVLGSKGLPRQPFCFFAFLFHGDVLIPVSCTMSWTSFHSSSGTLSIRSSPLNLFLTSTV